MPHVQALDPSRRQHKAGDTSGLCREAISGWNSRNITEVMLPNLADTTGWPQKITIVPFFNETVCHTAAHPVGSKCSRSLTFPTVPKL